MIALEIFIAVMVVGSLFITNLHIDDLERKIDKLNKPHDDN